MSAFIANSTSHELSTIVMPFLYSECDVNVNVKVQIDNRDTTFVVVTLVFAVSPIDNTIDQSNMFPFPFVIPV